MAITRHSNFDKTVQTIIDRNNISNKVNGMMVVVLDAIADPNAGPGKAIYRWDSTDASWILVSKSSTETMNFVTEELTIINGEVQLSYIPVDNTVWNGVILNGQLIMGDLNLQSVEINSGKISNIESQFNTYKLRVTYAYGTITQQITTAIEDVVDTTILNNIKTINGQEILGTGNIVVEGVLPSLKTINNESILGTGNIEIITDISGKADKIDTYTKTEVDAKIVELAPIPDISGKADITYVDSQIDSLINLAPSTLDTFKEIADQLAIDEGAVAALTSIVSNKVDKVSGKGLSTEDYTTAEKSKLASLSNYSLVTASSTVLGGIKVGSGLSIDVNGVLSASQGGLADSVEWTGVLNTPTTITGYGITDAYTKTQIDTSLSNKVDKITGKGLSAEDYTTAEKNKLAGLSNYSLPIASSTVLGGVKAGTNISIDANGVISANDTSVAWSEVTGKPTFATVATSGSYTDLINKPTAVSSFTNDSNYQTATQVNSAIQAVVGAAPAALDTLKEIADQLALDENAVSALTTTVSNKVDKITGKGLSTEDYTTAEKSKLAGIAAGAEVNVNPDWNAVSGDAQILNKPTSISGYGITDAYTKTQIDTSLSSKANIFNIATTEFNTGYTRGSKQVYGIEVDFGVLPNATFKEVVFTFNSTYKYWLDNQNSYTASTSNVLPINYVGNIGENISTILDKTNNKIKITCAFDGSSYTETKVVILYTK